MTFRENVERTAASIRLSRTVFNLLNIGHYSKKFALVRLELKTGNCVWFEGNPFV